jgi:hypothetical protein
MDKDPFGDGMDELPPNVPPGFLGEHGIDLRKVDGDGPYGLNAGVIQEWTWETTIIVVGIAYFLFFPVAYFVLWRSNKVPKRQKVVITTLMTIGIVLFAISVAT